MKTVFKQTVFAGALAALLSMQSIAFAAGAPPAPAAPTEEKKPVQILFTNVNIFDGFSDKLQNNMSVLVEANYIKEVGKKIKFCNTLIILSFMVYSLVTTENGLPVIGLMFMCLAFHAQNKGLNRPEKKSF